MTAKPFPTHMPGVTERHLLCWPITPDATSEPPPHDTQQRSDGGGGLRAKKKSSGNALHLHQSQRRAQLELLYIQGKKPDAVAATVRRYLHS